MMRTRDTLLAASLLTASLAPAAAAQQNPPGGARLPGARPAQPLTHQVARAARSRASLPRSAVAAYEEPSTDTEKQVAAIWREVLRLDQVGSKDGFLSLGGHSLAAMQIVRRIEEGLGVRLSHRALMLNTSLAQLAAALDAERRPGAPKPG